MRRWEPRRPGNVQQSQDFLSLSLLTSLSLSLSLSLWGPGDGGEKEKIMNVLLSWAGPVFDLVINAFSLRGSLLFSGRGRENEKRACRRER